MPPGASTATRSMRTSPRTTSTGNSICCRASCSVSGSSGTLSAMRIRTPETCNCSSSTRFPSRAVGRHSSSTRSTLALSASVSTTTSRSSSGPANLPVTLPTCDRAGVRLTATSSSRRAAHSLEKANQISAIITSRSTARIPAVQRSPRSSARSAHRSGPMEKWMRNGESVWLIAKAPSSRMSPMGDSQRIPTPAPCSRDSDSSSSALPAS